MEVKKPEPTDWPSINEFLDKTLRPQVNWSLQEEYPLAFAETNRDNIRVIKEDNKVVAHAVVHTNIIKTHFHLFRVGLIGSVVTDETKRGQGMSREIIKSCLQNCKDQNCDLAILWTDLFNFYSQFGFEVAGSEVALQVTPDFTGEIKDSIKIMDTPKVSAQALLKVYNKHQMRSVRQVSDIQKYLQIPNTEVYTAWNNLTNALEAYCVVGKGADFSNYIHEWGGSVSSILSLTKHIVEKKQAPITLITPPQCQNLISQMEKHRAKKFFGVLGMIAITNPESFCAKIKKGARTLGYDSFVFDFKEGRYFFGYGDEIYCTDSDQDITRLVFGPVEPQQIHSFSETALDALKEIFPIPFWVWGWDSI